MITTDDENVPAALERDGDSGNHLGAGADTTVPTSADIADLLRSRPPFGAPADEVAPWVERKEAMVAAIEKATR